MLTHKQLRTKALKNAEVKAEFDQLADEFSLLEEFLKARQTKPSGDCQHQMPNRIRGGL